MNKQIILEDEIIIIESCKECPLNSGEYCRILDIALPMEYKYLNDAIFEKCRLQHEVGPYDNNDE